MPKKKNAKEKKGTRLDSHRTHDEIYKFHKFFDKLLPIGYGGSRPGGTVKCIHDFAPLPTEYAAHLLIPESGLWLVSIQVESEWGYGEVSFYQQISKPSNLGAIVSIGAPVGGLLLLVLIFFWLQKNNPATADWVN